MQDIEQILKTSYPKTVYDAVRYGYQYRKVSETVGENLHFSLGFMNFPSNYLYKDNSADTIEVDRVNADERGPGTYYVPMEINIAYTPEDACEKTYLPLS